MSKPEGKDIASATLMAGGILLALTDALADTSKVSPGVHLRALNAGDLDREVYIAKAARALDDLLFRQIKLATAGENDLLPHDVYGLDPVTKVPLYQAFDWAKARDFDDYISTVDEVKALGLPREPYSTERGVIAYFGQCAQFLCEEVEWGPFRGGGILVRAHRFDGTDVIKPVQMLLMAKP